MANLQNNQRIDPRKARKTPIGGAVMKAAGVFNFLNENPAPNRAEAKARTKARREWYSKNMDTSKRAKKANKAKRQLQNRTYRRMSETGESYNRARAYSRPVTRVTKSKSVNPRYKSIMNKARKRNANRKSASRRRSGR